MARRWAMVANPVAAAQMMVFATVAGAVRPGYDPNRNWISQLSLGPGGWLNDLNLAVCGLWLLLGAAGITAVVLLGRGVRRPWAWPAGLLGGRDHAGLLSGGRRAGAARLVRGVAGRAERTAGAVSLYTGLCWIALISLVLLGRVSKCV